jgi:hypothetical protein
MENKVIFIILTIILVITLVFNIILLSQRVAKTEMYEYEYLKIVKYEVDTALVDDDLIEHKIRNRGVFKDLIDFEKDMYLSCLIILLVPLILSVLLLLAEFIAGLKNSLQGTVFKIFNLINLIFCAVFAIIYFVLFCIYCCINDTDKAIRKYSLIFNSKAVKNRSLTHIFLDLILFIALAVAAVLSFLAMKNGTSSSGSSSSSSARKETNQTKENQPIKKQDNAGASERPNNLLTKDAK